MDVDDCNILSGDASCDFSVIGTIPGLLAERKLLDGVIQLLQNEEDTISAHLDDDGTMTSTLLTNIGNGGYSNTTLTTELLSNSLLSDEVLVAACGRTPFFSQPQFQSILLANVPLTRPVWDHVETAMAAHMDQPYQDTVRAAQDTSTQRTLRAVGRDLEVLQSTRMRTIYDLLGLYEDADDDPDSTYAMVHYLTDSLSDKHWQKLAVGTCLSLDTLTWARTILSGIPLDDVEDTAFYDFMDLSLDLAEDSLTWFQMDDTQSGLLADVANGTTLMSTYAKTVQSLLADTLRIPYPEPMPELPASKRGQESDNAVVKESINKDEVKVYPNPFTDDFVVDFALVDEAKEVYIEVFDLTGRNVFAKRLYNTQVGRTLVNPGPCNGTYIMRMSVDGRPFKHEKLICMQARQ